MLHLVIANLNYSSWSMRAWLALELAEVPFRMMDVGMKVEEGWKERILTFSGAGRVPVLVDGALSIHESLAICEYAAELAHQARLWPTDAQLRARARAISTEMVSSFHALRAQMPCNVRRRGAQVERTAELQADIDRILGIWDASLSAGPGPYLFGDRFTIADCMFAPVQFRFRTYGVELSGASAAYQKAFFAHPLIRKLEDIAAGTSAIPEYDE